MSNSRIRKEALYLSDKMAYELGLNNSQYEDIYEINYDFIYSLRNTMDYVVDGYEWAIDDYYDALDLRNDDLRWVLTNSQYRRFMNLDYFYRPIAVATSGWFFRIYNVYTNHSLFYMSKPSVYRTYSGGHYREYYSNQSHYQNKYKHNIYTGNTVIRNDKNFKSNKNSDFGSVNVRPNTSRQNNSNVVNTSNRRSSTTSSNRGSSDRASQSNVSRPSSTNSSSVNSSSLRNQNRTSGSSSDVTTSEQPATSPSSTNRSDYSNSNRSSVNSSSNNRNSSSGNSSSRSSMNRNTNSGSGNNSSVNRSSSSRSSSGSSTRSSSSSSSSSSSNRGRGGR
jgi:hypothetical protein